MTSSPWNNTWDCNRVALTHTLLGASSTTYGIYHKYLVDSITLRDPIADAPPQVFDYTYVGNPAWAFENDVMYVWSTAGNTGHGVESWSSYRGYAEVLMETGSGSAKSYTRTQFFRGLDNAYRGSAGQVAVSVTPYGAATSTVDHPALQGMVASTLTGPGPSIAEAQVRSFNTYGVDTFVTGPRQHNVALVRQAEVENWTRQPDQPAGTPVWLKSTTETDYDPQLRLPVTQRVDPDIGTAGDETCSTLEYAWSIQNAAGNAPANFNDSAFWGDSLYIVVPAAGETWWGGCDTNTGTLTGAWETYYDESVPGSLNNNGLSRGLPTTERTLVAQNDWLESRATYDAQGRILTAKTPADIENGTQTSWAYTPGVTMSSVTVTNPMGYQSTSWMDVRTGNLVKHMDTNGLYTHYRYDAAGRLVAGWAPAQNIAYTDTDPQTDPADQPGATVLPTVSYIYDANAPGLAVRNRPVAVASAQFTGFNGTTPVTSSLAGSVRRSYTFFDGFGRVVQQHSVAPDGSGGRLVTATGFTDTGAKAWSTEPFFDSDPAQFASGLVDVTTATVARHSTTQYDWAGRPLEQSLVLGNPGAVAPNEIATTAYEYLGDSTRVTAPTGAVTESVTDALGRIVSQTQFPETGSTLDEILTQYSYRVQGSSVPGDELGFSEVTVTDAAQEVTVFVSDLAGRKTKLLDPNAGLSTYSYDDAGRVTSIVSQTGTISMEYDVLGRMTWRGVGSSTSPDTSQSYATWTYDPVGHLGKLDTETAWTATPVGNFEFERRFTYNGLGQVESTTTHLPESVLLGELSGGVYETSVEYDALGQLKSSEFVATTPGQTALWPLPDVKVTPTLDLFGRATSLTLKDLGTQQELDIVTGVEFDEAGKLVTREYGNGVVRTYGWDADWGSLETLSATYDDGVETVHSETYVRDGAGRVTSVLDNVVDINQCFEYDGFNRLGSAWTDTGTCSTLGAAAQPTGADVELGYALAYEYEPTGQVDKVSDLLALIQPSARQYHYDYLDHPNAVSSVTDGSATDAFTYDSAGRMLTRTVNSQMTQMTWDVSSNLTATEGLGGNVVYVYDAGGQRVAQIKVSELTGSATPVSATVYLGDVQATDANTASTSVGDVAATRFVTFGGATVATHTVTSTQSSWALLFGDVQGSAQVSMPLVPDALAGTGFADADATHIPTRDAYLPYGASRGGSDLAVDRGWLGQVEDSGTGLTYLNARYYDPSLGRFLSPDPLMNPGDPRTLDPYRYADNNPIVYHDATGLCSGLSGSNLLACETGGGFGSAYAAQKTASLNYAAARNDQGNGGRPKRSPVTYPTVPAQWQIDSSSGFSDYRIAGEQLAGLWSGEDQLRSDRRGSTISAETSMINYGLLMGGKVYNGGPLCGRHMVCIVGVGFTGVGKGGAPNAITTGHVVLFRGDELGSWLQFHEYVHVREQTQRGYDEYLGDYKAEWTYARSLGLDDHDGNLIEMHADNIADIASARYNSEGGVGAPSGSVMSAFDSTIYDRGIQYQTRVPGAPDTYNDERLRALVN